MKEIRRRTYKFHTKHILIAKKIMEATFTKEVLIKRVQALAKGKNPGPYGLIAEFPRAY